MTSTTIHLTIIIITAGYLLHFSNAEFSVKSHVFYELHKRNNRTNTYIEDEYERVPVVDPVSDYSRHTPIAFDSNKLTRIVIHGYLSSRRSFLRYVRAFLKLDDCNVIVVNWLWGSVTYNYYSARNRAIQVKQNVHK